MEEVREGGRGVRWGFVRGLVRGWGLVGLGVAMVEPSVEF